MTIQKIRELANKILLEIEEERKVKRLVHESQKVDFVLSKLEASANRILCLTTEVHRFELNLNHPDVIKKFQNEGWIQWRDTKNDNKNYAFF